MDEHIQRITEKLQKLLKQHHALRRENEKLRLELEETRGLQSESSRQIEDLEQKVAILKTATNNMSAEDKKELGKKLAFYIKEIDRCIALLSE